MLGGLDESPARLGTDEAHLLGLVFVDPEDGDDGCGKDQEDDGKGAKGPSEVGLGVEELGDGGAGKSGAEVGRGVEREDDHTIAQRRDVGHEDADHKTQCGIADPVQHY